MSSFDEIQKRRLKRLAETNVKFFKITKDLKRRISNFLKNLSDREPTAAELSSLYNLIFTTYNQADGTLEFAIKDEYIKSIPEYAYVFNKYARGYDLGINLRPFDEQIEKAFASSQRFLTRSRTLSRNRKISEKITKIISEGVGRGDSLQIVNKKIDISLGLRDKTGAFTKQALREMAKGKLAYKNGRLYQTYRITRTEFARMQNKAMYDDFEAVKAAGVTTKLKIQVAGDDRMREQSSLMPIINPDGLSNDEGAFLYPDGVYRRLGADDLPPQWGIMDREAATPFIEEFNTADFERRSYNNYAEFEKAKGLA